MELTKEQEEARRGIVEVLKAMYACPQYRQYVEQKKLGLIDSRLKTADLMLENGIITLAELK